MNRKFNSYEVMPDEESNVVTLREAVGVFPDDEHLMAAIDDLEMAKFNRNDISVLGSEFKMRDVYHRATRNSFEMEDDPKTPRGVFVMPEEQSLAEAALVGAGVLLTVFVMGPVMGANLSETPNVFMLLVMAVIGGLLGYGAARLLRYVRHKRTLEQQQKGGLLMWVNTPTREREERAKAILARHGARDVHVNEVVREIAA